MGWVKGSDRMYILKVGFSKRKKKGSNFQRAPKQEGAASGPFPRTSYAGRPRKRDTLVDVENLCARWPLHRASTALKSSYHDGSMCIDAGFPPFQLLSWRRGSVCQRASRRVDTHNKQRKQGAGWGGGLCTSERQHRALRKEEGPQGINGQGLLWPCPEG